MGQHLPLEDLVANQVHCFFCPISDVECVLLIVKGMCSQDVCGSPKYREVDPWIPIDLLCHSSHACLR